MEKKAPERAERERKAARCDEEEEGGRKRNLQLPFCASLLLD